MPLGRLHHPAAPHLTPPLVAGVSGDGAHGRGLRRPAGDQRTRETQQRFGGISVERFVFVSGMDPSNTPYLMGHLTIFLDRDFDPLGQRTVWTLILLNQEKCLKGGVAH